MDDVICTSVLAASCRVFFRSTRSRLRAGGVRVSWLVIVELSYCSEALRRIASQDGSSPLYLFARHFFPEVTLFFFSFSSIAQLLYGSCSTRTRPCWHASLAVTHWGCCQWTLYRSMAGPSGAKGREGLSEKQREKATTWCNPLSSLAINTSLFFSFLHIVFYHQNLHRLLFSLLPPSIAALHLPQRNDIPVASALSTPPRCSLLPTP